jgi:hypothetical protein
MGKLRGPGGQAGAPLGKCMIADLLKHFLFKLAMLI